MDFPATVGAFDTIFNGDLSIFWGDAFVTKISITAGTDPAAPPAVPAAPTLVSPANASSPPQPITFDWNDVTGAVSYTIQIDDSSAFTAPLVREQSVTASIFAARRPRHDDPVLAGPRRQLGRCPGRLVGDAELHPAGAPAADGADEPGRQSVDRRRWQRVQRHGRRERRRAQRHGHLALEQQPGRGRRAGQRHRAHQRLHRHVHDHDLRGAGQHSGRDHGVAQRHEPDGHADRDARNGASACRDPAEPGLSPCSVAGGTGVQGTLVAVGRRACGRRRDRAVEQQPRRGGVPASVTVAGGATSAAFAVSTSAVTTATTVTISATYNGVTRTANLTVTPAPPPRSDATLTVTATGRSGERVTSAPAGINVATGAAARRRSPSVRRSR